ncbi:MAG TPA: hypothetical protein LFV92_07025 [Rickettsia endosymbiont of Ceroptres masudai]|nr:hypothetical protein [Rickettsia endosymbiont of Ceroptres masudai]
MKNARLSYRGLTTVILIYRIFLLFYWIATQSTTARNIMVPKNCTTKMLE